MLALLRSALHLLWMGLTVVPWALAVLAAAPWVKSATVYRMCRGWLQQVVWMAGPLLGIRNRVHGWHNLPTDPNARVVLLVKHQSTWETFAMPVLMPRPLAYVFKRELLSIPFFGWAMAKLEMVHIDRQRRAEAFNRVVAQGQQLLDKGIWMIMFPEGTRVQRGQVGQYKTGGTRLAVATGATVIPVAVTSARCWPARAWIKRPGVVDFSIGPPMPAIGRDPVDLMAEVQQWIEAEVQRLDPMPHG